MNPRLVFRRLPLTRRRQDAMAGQALTLSPKERKHRRRVWVTPAGSALAPCAVRRSGIAVCLNRLALNLWMATCCLGALQCSLGQEVGESGAVPGAGAKPRLWK